MLNYMLLIYALIQLSLLIWTYKWDYPTSLRLWVLRAMLFGMFYDNLIQGTGFLYISDAWFESASSLRFLLHATILPFLTIFALSIMQRAGVKIARNKLLMNACWLFTFAALGFGLYHEAFLLELAPITVMGVEKLVSTSGMPPIATILTNIIILPMAAAIWKVSGWKWMFLGSLFIFVLNGATGPKPWGFIVGNFAEVVFIVSLLFTERKFMRKH
ncbi:hypothetical protein [Thalassomonas sp. M1454]|uniref:hypothetical protein n=1 Tax=Thalassomonas sp. M1454 TaxID=2594477 RepID=UPI00117DCE2A|nr:hypothetical protein [Thalassomonas sp. M1454]TRX55055.1 hypothetical protein FNN08_10670 [Thalassomonas sp. M1454]